MNTPGPVLRDIHPPPPPSWWPPAYGWWVLAVVLAALLVVAVTWGRRRLSRHRRIRRFVQQLERARERYRRSGDQATYAGTLSQWLRRAARLHDDGAPRLQGDAWLDFLRQHAPRGMDTGALEALDAAVYRPGASLDEPAATAAVRDWVRHALARA